MLLLLLFEQISPELHSDNYTPNFSSAVIGQFCGFIDPGMDLILVPFCRGLLKTTTFHFFLVVNTD